MMRNCELHRKCHFSCKAGKRGKKIGSWKRKRRCQKFDLEFFIFLFFFKNCLKCAWKGKCDLNDWVDLIVVVFSFSLNYAYKANHFWLKIFFEYFKMLVTVIGLFTDCSKAANILEYVWVAKLLRYEILHQSFQLKNVSIEKKTTKNRILTKWKLWHRLSHAWIHPRLKNPGVSSPNIYIFLVNAEREPFSHTPVLRF